MATVPADRERLTIGVGEKMDLEITPDKPIQWTVNERAGVRGSIEDKGRGATYTAGAEASSPVINIKSRITNGSIGQLEIKVIEPTGIKIEKVLDISRMRITIERFPGDTNPVKIKQGVQGVYMILQFQLVPDTVSFSRLEYVEVQESATNVTGYFTSKTRREIFHNTNTEWAGVRDDNRVSGADLAGLGGIAPPWVKGSFDWVIPNRYRVDGINKQFDTVTQRMQIEGKPMAGRSGVLKFNETSDAFSVRSPDEKTGWDQ